MTDCISDFVRMRRGAGMYSDHGRLQYSTESPYRSRERPYAILAFIGGHFSPVCTKAGVVPCTSSARLQAWPGRVSSTCIIYIQTLLDQGQPSLGVVRSTCLSPLFSLVLPMDDLSNPQPRFFTVDAHDRFPTKTTMQDISTVVPSLIFLLCTSFLYGVYTRPIVNPQV